VRWYRIVTIVLGSLLGLWLLTRLAGLALMAYAASKMPPAALDPTRGGLYTRVS
jgi:hypothetical protein